MVHGGARAEDWPYHGTLWSKAGLETRTWSVAHQFECEILSAFVGRMDWRPNQVTVCGDIDAAVDVTVNDPKLRSEQVTAQELRVFCIYVDKFSSNS